MNLKKECGEAMRAARQVKVVVSGLVVCLLVIPGVVSAAPTESVGRDEVVAEANGKKILRPVLDSAFERQLGKQRLSLDESQVHTLRKAVLDRLVDRELLFEAAAQKNMVPTDSELDTFVADIKAERGAEAYAAMLAEGELTEAEFWKGLRTDIAIKRYLESEVYSGVNVNDDEVAVSYQANPERFSTPEEVHVRHILIRVPEDATPDAISAAETRASLIAEKARSGADFAQLAREFSEAHNKANGGDLGFITENQLDPDFSKAAFEVATGEISNPVRTRFGFHVIKVEERRQIPAKDSIALKAQFRESLLQEKRDKALQGAIAALRAKAKIILYVK